MIANRMKGIGISVFSELDKLRRELELSGRSVINLSIGSPDRSPSMEVRRLLSEKVLNGGSYGYTLTRGNHEFRQSCALWYKERFGVELDPETEVLPLMGSQDGLAHIFWAYINPGDKALIPDPGYPIYTAGLLLAEGKKVSVPLKAESYFLPDLSSIDPDDAKDAKLFILNYPNNPTAAVASLSFFEELVEFAKEYNIIICHDAAYSELSFDGYRPSSFLEARGAKEVGVEFHSVSKTHNLAGARLGFVVGNPEVISTLTKLKANIDYGVFEPILSAGAYVLQASQGEVEANRLAYQRRRDIFVQGCAQAGWNMQSPKGSMFIWAPIPTKQDSVSFSFSLAKETGVIVVPGIEFGQFGEGYVRIALVQEDSKIEESVSRIRQFLNKQD